MNSINLKKNLQSKAEEETGLSHLLKKWLSGEDVCHLLGISNRTLQTYRDQRILPFVQIGRKLYYKASDIDDHMEAHYIKKGGAL